MLTTASVFQRALSLVVMLANPGLGCRVSGSNEGMWRGWISALSVVAFSL